MIRRSFPAPATLARRLTIASLAAACVATLCWTGANAQFQKPEAKPNPAALIAKPAGPNAYRIATMNVEWWSNIFLPRKVLATTRPGLDDGIVRVLKNAEGQADEENWEIARSILAMQPDIVVFQEGCAQDDLNYFNTQFLDGYFETLHVFKSNNERGQSTGIMLRPGLKVLEWREEYYNDPDTNDVNPLDDKLFARGPGFALVQAANGKRFWVGTNHTKSKSGNSVAVTKWRNAEAVRTNQIIAELKQTGPKEVFFLGDMNDELGMQEFEQQAGGSAADLTAGKGPNALTILTKPLADEGGLSYHGSRSRRFLSFIDHAYATPEAAKWVTKVDIFSSDLADVTSDHYPVYFDIKVP